MCAGHSGSLEDRGKFAGTTVGTVSMGLVDGPLPATNWKSRAAKRKLTNAQLAEQLWSINIRRSRLSLDKAGFTVDNHFLRIPCRHCNDDNNDNNNNNKLVMPLRHTKNTSEVRFIHNNQQCKILSYKVLLNLSIGPFFLN